VDWDEWGRLTRFLESARIAFQREARLWQSLELEDPRNATVHVVDGDASYSVTLDQHRAAVSDDWLLFGLVLISSYAVAEAATADKLGLTQLTNIGGIEVWGKRLLDGAGNSWSDVKDGLPGAVEVAAIRNVIAHGDRTYSANAVKRLSAAGITDRVAGTPVVLDYGTLREYRARLKSLLRAGRI